MEASEGTPPCGPVVWVLSCGGSKKVSKKESFGGEGGVGG